MMHLTTLAARRRIRVFVFCVTALICGARNSTLHAVPLYGSDAPADIVNTIDPLTAAATLVGPLGIDGLAGGLAYDPWSDTLYLSNTPLNFLSAVVRTTGAATAFGSSVMPGGVGIPGLAFHRDSMTLYGSTTDGRLITIDTGTGVGMAVGAFGVGSTGGGLAFDYDLKVLYMVSQVTDSLYTVDIGTGAATLVGSLSLPANGLNFGLAWASEHGLLMSSQNHDRLYQLDPLTGQATEIGVLLDIAGLAFAEPIPEPGTLTLLALGGLGLWRKRRRH